MSCKTPKCVLLVSHLSIVVKIDPIIYLSSSNDRIADGRNNTMVLGSKGGHN